MNETRGCIPDSRYIASPEFLLTTMHYFAIIELPVMCFGAYCILFKTPSSVKSVKWLMLNLHVWSVFSDIWLCVIQIPYILLPCAVGYPLGELNAPRTGVYFNITFVAGLSASVLAIYENRYFVLYGYKTCWKHFRKPVLFLIYLYVPFIFLPPILNVPDQETSLPIVMSTIPCQNPQTYENREMFVLSLDYKLPVLCVVVATVVLATSIGTFFALIFHRLRKNRHLSNFSQRTRIMQRSFAIALTMQTVFMMSCILAPVCTGFLVIYFWYHNQALNNFIFIVLSLHGVGSTIVMVCVHKPYRDFTFGWVPTVLKLLEKLVNIQKKAVTISAL